MEPAAWHAVCNSRNVGRTGRLKTGEDMSALRSSEVDDFQDFAIHKIETAIRKEFEGPFEVRVYWSGHKNLQKLTGQVCGDSGMVVVASDTSSDRSRALNKVIRKLRIRIRKNKRRGKNGALGRRQRATDPHL